MVRDPALYGSCDPVFYCGLAIVVSTSIVALLSQLIISFRNHEHHGTARWAGFGEMRHAGYLQRYNRIKGPIFGKTCGPRWFGSYLTNGEQPHSLVVAPTRAGKGVGVVIPTLLTFKGSVIALDVKGELFELTSRARKAGGDAVFKFSPLDPERRTHCYNPSSILQLYRSSGSLPRRAASPQTSSRPKARERKALSTARGTFSLRASLPVLSAVRQQLVRSTTYLLNLERSTNFCAPRGRKPK